MKKKLLSLGIILSIILLTGCNKKIFDTQYTFNRIVCNYNGEKFELKIDKWTDYDGKQLQVKSDGKTYLLSANNCYMVEEIE